MATTKITYNGTEISSADETAPVSVTYNGSTIASIAEGETKTLGCNGKYASTNIVVGSKTLTCADKIMASDVSIEVESASLGNYIVFSSTSSFTLGTANGLKNDGTIQYSTNGTTWATWSGGTISSGSDNKIYLRGSNNTRYATAAAASYSTQFVLTGSNIQCDGNIENLLDYATVASGGHPTMASCCYAYMFYGCTALTKAPSLSATTLSVSCYNSMFRGCTSLSEAPNLPATTMVNYCYSSMFMSCTALTKAPSLSATTVATSCYNLMFFGCTSLTSVPILPATAMASSCYSGMFRNCTALKFSASETGIYTNAYRLPSSGTGTTATNWNSNMLASTGGTFTGNPTINTTYYTNATIV